MYPDDRTIHFKKSIGKHRITINDQVINHPYTIEENGIYEIKTSSSFLWKKTSQSITFSKDDSPPQTPIIINASNDFYPLGHAIQITHEAKVVYEALLDKKPYTLGTPIEEEGVHEIKITAKKQNGLTSTKTHTFELDNTSFTEDEITTFLNYFFHQPHPDITQPEIFKWITDVPVTMSGNYNDVDLTTITNTLQTFSSTLPVNFDFRDPATHHRTLNKGIEIVFTKGALFKYHGFEDPIETGENTIVGVAITSDANYSEGYRKVIVLIDSERSEKERQNIIVHELIHALGLIYHFENDEKSILYPYSNSNILQPSNLDMKMLQILYWDKLRIGMQEEETERLLLQIMK